MKKIALITALVIGTGTAAFWCFLGFYAVCFTLTWAVYLRRTEAVAAKPQLSYAEV